MLLRQGTAPSRQELEDRAGPVLDPKPAMQVCQAAMRAVFTAFEGERRRSNGDAAANHERKERRNETATRASDGEQ